MNWNNLFGAGSDTIGGLGGLWQMVGALLNWDIIKGLIVFVLAMSAGGAILRAFAGKQGVIRRHRITMGAAGAYWASDADLKDLKAAGWSTQSGKPVRSTLAYVDEDSQQEIASMGVESYGGEDD